MSQCRHSPDKVYDRCEPPVVGVTAPDPRLDEIQARLSAATPGPWETMRSGLLGTRVVRVDGEWDGLIPDEFVTLVTPALRIYCDADLIANAPADLAYLLAELRKAHEALTRVEEVHRPRQFNPISDGVYFGQTEFDHNICAHDHERWPCPTMEALRTAVAAANGGGHG